MNCLENTIQNIQAGHLEYLDDLLTQFNPLIYNWLKRNHLLHSEEKEDFYSMAKIILLECALEFDKNKHVPFQSYFKITLWHKYGNYLHKKKFPCIPIDTFEDKSDHQDFTETIEEKEKVQHLQKQIKKLNASEQYIFNKLLEGETPEMIGRSLGISKKTVLNKKYNIIKKLKEVLKE